MNRRVIKSVIFIVLALGVVGLLSNIGRDPLWLVKQVAIYGGIAAIIYLVYRVYMKKRMGQEYSSYKKAAKQSKRRFDDRAPSPLKSNPQVKSISQARKSKKASALKKTKQTHLTVIEGKKGKKKNRASF